jgi:FAD-dependent urate hydroxylase
MAEVGRVLIVGGGIGGLSLATALHRRSWWSGATLCETDLEALWGEVGPCLGITRIRLQEILLAGAAPVPHRLGVAVTAVAADTDRVSVGFSDGTSGDYDLVVGADGIHRLV